MQLHSFCWLNSISKYLMFNVLCVAFSDTVLVNVLLCLLQLPMTSTYCGFLFCKLISTGVKMTQALTDCLQQLRPAQLMSHRAILWLPWGRLSVLSPDCMYFFCIPFHSLLTQRWPLLRVYFVHNVYIWDLGASYMVAIWRWPLRVRVSRKSFMHCMLL